MTTVLLQLLTPGGRIAEDEKDVIIRQLNEDLMRATREIENYLVAARADLGHTGPPPEEASAVARFSRIFHRRWGLAKDPSDVVRVPVNHRQSHNTRYLVWVRVFGAFNDGWNQGKSGVQRYAGFLAVVQLAAPAVQGADGRDEWPAAQSGSATRRRVNSASHSASGAVMTTSGSGEIQRGLARELAVGLGRRGEQGVLRCACSRGARSGGLTWTGSSGPSTVVCQSTRGPADERCRVRSAGARTVTSSAPNMAIGAASGSIEPFASVCGCSTVDSSWTDAVASEAPACVASAGAAQARHGAGPVVAPVRL